MIYTPEQPDLPPWGSSTLPYIPQTAKPETIMGTFGSPGAPPPGYVFVERVYTDWFFTQPPSYIVPRHHYRLGSGGWAQAQSEYPAGVTTGIGGRPIPTLQSFIIHSDDPTQYANLPSGAAWQPGNTIIGTPQWIFYRSEIRYWKYSTIDGPFWEFDCSFDWYTKVG